VLWKISLVATWKDIWRKKKGWKHLRIKVTIDIYVSNILHTILTSFKFLNWYFQRSKTAVMVKNQNFLAPWLQKSPWDVVATLGQVWLLLAKIIIPTHRVQIKVKDWSLKQPLIAPNIWEKSQHSTANRACLPWEKSPGPFLPFFL
jgi:hypothetical protein